MTITLQKTRMLTVCFFFFKLSKLLSPRINCISYTNSSVFITVYINIYGITDLRTLSITVLSLVSPWTLEVTD